MLIAFLLNISEWRKSNRMQFKCVSYAYPGALLSLVSFKSIISPLLEKKRQLLEEAVYTLRGDESGGATESSQSRDKEEPLGLDLILGVATGGDGHNRRL